ncbi:MAG: outer membrane protein assembly factor BamB [Limisphaerales bacterium]|jgi:outer membrane protein assembly factor BamB
MKKTSVSSVRLMVAGLVFCLTTILPAEKVPGTFAELRQGVVVLIASGDAKAGEVAGKLAASGDNLVHVLAGSPKEASAIRSQVAKAGLKGIVTVEELPLSPLPYRDHLVNSIVVMDLKQARADGLKMKEARRCLTAFGHMASCKNGKLDHVEVMPIPEGMDTWTHRYYGPDGIPVSQDTVFDLPLGFKWNAGLPMNFNDPEQAANRYSSTRAMVLDDGRCFTFSTSVHENLGEGWKSEYGKDQYLTCRDAFNGRMLWRKRIGDTYYGGLYIENLAPLISTGRHLYLAGENGKMLKISTRTGETVAELPTKYIPGFIAATDGIVVAATWKQGNKVGSVERYDRRRMDWAINAGTVEAYDDQTGKRLWKQDLLGTSLLLAEGRVIIVNRDEPDALELNHRRKDKAGTLKHPLNRVMALDLKSGKRLWTSEAPKMGLLQQTLNLEAAGSGAVSVATANRSKVNLLDAATGKPLSLEEAKKVHDKFFRYRNHICTPVFKVNGIDLSNRGGTITKGKEKVKFGGARSACLTGTMPAYGAGYIAQNWCNCSPGQIPGLLAVASIGRMPTPEEMEAPAQPITYSTYSPGEDGVGRESKWSSFRGNPSRSSSSDSVIGKDVKELWTTKVTASRKDGTVKRDWNAFLNSRLTAPVISEGLTIVGDIDHNEVIAVNLMNGKEAWRHTTAGRMDTSPTLHEGICLVADRTGYVTGLKVKTGEVIYRLRIAPEEKRMMSFGKLESVWPVIGGVLVAEGRAYATAGRTQGSDGGLIVRAFEPETGEPIWARAIPQSGNGIKTAKAKRNDALIMEGEYIRLMDHYLEADTGEFVIAPSTIRINVAVAAKEKELGRKVDRFELRKIQTAARPGQQVDLGNEGLYSWNWTRLGNRKFQDLAFDGEKGETISWNGSSIGTSRQNVVVVKVDGKKKAVRLPEGSQGTSLILCENMLLQGGSLIDQGDQKGFVRAIDLKTGKVAWEKTYASQLAFNGLAVDRGEIIASFNDGSVVKIK